jgi:hypothetical protein
MRLQNRTIGTCAYMGGLPAVLEDFAWSWGQMVQFNAECLCGPGERVHYARSALSFHAAARNSLVDSMMGDWLLMLDADHRFEPDIAARMLDRMDSAGIDVLTGMYQFKQPPHSPVLYLANGDYFAPLGSWRPADVSSDVSLFPVDACGAGCLMVRRPVFARIKDELGGGPFDVIPPFGEDMSFCKRLQQLGIKVYCDPRIECHHLQVRALSLADYDRGAYEVGAEVPVDAFALGPVPGRTG